MSILIYAENSEGTFKKSVLEAATYAAGLSKQNGDKVIAVTLGDINAGEFDKLALYGVSKLVKISGATAFDAQIFSEAIAAVAGSESAKTIVIANTYSGKSIAPRVSAKLGASLATNVISLPESGEGFTIKRSVFSGKGFAYVSLTRDIKVVALSPNSIELTENPVSIEVVDGASAGSAKTNVIGVSKSAGKIPLTEAERVVSAGRGMKGPENWHLVEELAGLLGAATACSKPVSDMEWRPHSEHVGQTGITIKPNLYVAIGISGAIQHLAGVSSSKTIVVINKDPEAPFFKVADYGIVGDAFEILPQLIAAAKS